MRLFKNPLFLSQLFYLVALLIASALLSCASTSSSEDDDDDDSDSKKTSAPAANNTGTSNIAANNGGTRNPAANNAATSNTMSSVGSLNDGNTATQPPANTPPAGIDSVPPSTNLAALNNKSVDKPPPDADAPPVGGNVSSAPTIPPNDLQGLDDPPASATGANTPQKTESAKASQDGQDQGKTTTYIVKKGDTLWDLSRKYKGNPFAWKNLWAINTPPIKNPNLIYPGETLHWQDLDGKTEGTTAPPPHIKTLLERTEEEVFSINYLQPTNRFDIYTIPQFPPAWGQNDGILLNPSNLPLDPDVQPEGEAEEVHAINFALPGFLTAQDPNSLGEIVALFSTSLLAEPSDGRKSVMYASFENIPKVGDRFLTIRPMDHITKPNMDNTDTDFWIYTGVIQVLETAGRPQDRISIAVESGQYGVMPEDQIIPFQDLKRTVPLNMGPASTTFHGEVQAVAEANVSIAGLNQFVFFEKKGQNISVNEDIDLYMPPGGHIHFEDEGLGSVKVGHAKVVEVNDEWVCALVLSAEKEIAVGSLSWPGF